VTQSEYRALWKVVGEFARIEPSPELGVQQDAEFRQILGPIPDGEYEVKVQWDAVEIPPHVRIALMGETF